MMAPAFEKVSQEMHGQARFVKVNTEVEQTLAARYNIRSIPTMIIFKNGKPVDQIMGKVPKGTLVDFINKNA
jgi:thioredoxin-like negative regulator of GroEL